MNKVSQLALTLACFTAIPSAANAAVSIDFSFDGEPQERSSPNIIAGTVKGRLTFSETGFNKSPINIVILSATGTPLNENTVIDYVDHSSHDFDISTDGTVTRADMAYGFYTKDKRYSLYAGMGGGIDQFTSSFSEMPRGPGNGLMITNDNGFAGITFSLTPAVASAVPEPATWAMMLVGFGMIGATARYRRRSTKVTYA